jgi:hypothetical protein
MGGGDPVDSPVFAAIFAFPFFSPIRSNVNRGSHAGIGFTRSIPRFARI